jgi:hypothetical protein
MNRYDWTVRDVVMLLVALAVAGALTFVSYKLASARMGLNWGFGPEWECSNTVGPKDLRCVSRTPVPEQSQGH